MMVSRPYSEPALTSTPIRAVRTALVGAALPGPKSRTAAAKTARASAATIFEAPRSEIILDAHAIAASVLLDELLRVFFTAGVEVAFACKVVAPCLQLDLALPLPRADAYVEDRARARHRSTEGSGAACVLGVERGGDP